MRDQSHLRHQDRQADHAARRRRLAQVVGDDGVALIAATPERNRNNDVDYPYRPNSDFRYLTGFSEPEAVAVIAPGFEEGDYLLFCRERNVEQEIWVGRRAGPEGAMAWYGADSAFDIEDFDNWLAKLLNGRRRLYLTLGTHKEFEHDVLRRMEKLRSQGRRATPPNEIVALDRIVQEMRLRKSGEEVALMRQAAATSARAHVAAMQAVQPGMYEYQLAAVLHYEFEVDGMTWAYPSIVGAGENACVLHYIENSAPMKDGDLVLIDAGAEYRGYAGDITRTFPVNGRFSEAQRELYDVVLAANRAAIAAARPGAPVNAVHQAALHVLVDGLLKLGLLEGDAEDVIETESYQRFFMHGTSHWIGMDVHDVGDYKSDGEWRLLEPGMALTVEPGLYVQANSEGAPRRFWNTGIRIEDDIVITDDGCEVLTSDVPKDADEIEALMAGETVGASA
ncbi:peptidase M24 [Salinisphaera dokdonensis CL-ES53]|uniref:Xaa-Pro aminopeptidase n=1 Tax=Salinisphaera dokdonensis CL-ES53 TaxID=1304272 RepID=A0ABV2AX21_9GAMM